MATYLCSKYQRMLYESPKAFHEFIDWFGPCKPVAGWKAVGFYAVNFVCDTDGNFIKVGKNIQFGEGEFGRTLRLHPVFACRNVKTADPARPAGGGTVFLSGFA